MIVVKDVEILKVRPDTKYIVKEELILEDETRNRTRIPLAIYTLPGNSNNETWIGLFPEVDKKIGHIFKQYEKLQEEVHNLKWTLTMATRRVLEFQAKIDKFQAAGFWERLKYLVKGWR